MHAPSFFVKGSKSPPAGYSIPYTRTDVRTIGNSSIRVVRLRESMPDIPVRTNKQKARSTFDPYGYFMFKLANLPDDSFTVVLTGRTKAQPVLLHPVAKGKV